MGALGSSRLGLRGFAWAASISCAIAQTPPTPPPATDPPRAHPSAAYPLRVSANRRYLVDRDGVPFLLMGDSPQALTVNLSEAEADAFFADREAHGFNAVWVNLLCATYTGGRPDGSTYDGIVPFTTPVSFQVVTLPSVARSVSPPLEVPR